MLPTEAAGDALACVLEQPSPVAVFRLAGELNFATAPLVRNALHKALADDPSAIVVDLAGVTVDDDVALTVFPAFARAAAAWPGCAVLLCAPAPAAAAGLDRLAVGRTLLVYPDRASACAAADALPVPYRFGRRLWPTPASAGVAREMVANACRAWHVAHLIDDAELVVTELMSNAVRHASGSLELLLVLRGRFLHVSVRDGSSTLPSMVLPNSETDEGGRGLLLLDAVAAGWGSVPVPGGKVVWATLRIRR
jgi:anti-anti-sigma regulatory factor